MTPRREQTLFVGAALGLWLFFVVQTLFTPVLLDDWFQLRYWRDHPYGLSGLWEFGYYNYFHYNPRIGEVFLAIVDGPLVVHMIVTPVVQIAALVTAFVIAFGRWPRPTLRDLQLLLFLQVMIWLVIPISGITYFYRPIATNYLWAFTFTLALFVPYRLALARGTARPQLWLAPIMFVLGWIAGMCNEHTGPTAMVAMAGFIYVAWHRRQLRAWMVAGMVGLYVGYPMLFFAPGQTVRYGGLATRATPSQLLAERSFSGCFEILLDFVYEARLGLLVLAAAVVRYVLVVRQRGDRIPAAPRESVMSVVLLVAASGAIVATLFASPTTTDRVLYAPAILLVGALAVCAEHMFAERSVRRLVIAACMALLAYNAVRFTATYAAVKAENDERIAILRNTRPGTVAVVPSYEHADRTRWHLGDDFRMYPWLADYVGGELFDLARVDLDRLDRRPPPRYRATRTYDPPLAPAIAAKLPPVRELPTYRQLLEDPTSWPRLIAAIADAPDRLARFTIDVVGLPFNDPKRRPIRVVESTPAGIAFVAGHPYDVPARHFIRIRGSTLPKRVESAHLSGCGTTQDVVLVPDGDDVLLPVDERLCRGVFTAILCEPDRCWVAGWY